MHFSGLVAKISVRRKYFVAERQEERFFFFVDLRTGHGKSVIFRAF